MWVCPGDGVSHAAVESLLVLLHASASDVVLPDGFDDACSARLAVRETSPGLAVVTHVFALLATVGVAVLVEVRVI